MPKTLGVIGLGSMGLGGADDSSVVKYYAALAGLDLPVAAQEKP